MRKTDPHGRTFKLLRMVTNQKVLVFFMGENSIRIFFYEHSNIKLGVF